MKCTGGVHRNSQAQPEARGQSCSKMPVDNELLHCYVVVLIKLKREAVTLI